jgi:dienelactone hydrolase
MEDAVGFDWTGFDVDEMGVRERAFVVERGGDRITGILWTPDAAAPVPLVLIGHGGRSEKRNPAGLALARRFVRHDGVAAVAIDAIDHGERGPIRESNLPAYEDLWKRPDTFDRMVADWQATLDAVEQLPEIDRERVGYWGLSMGTMLGLPFVAAEPRIRAAVLGLCGFRGSSAIRGRFGERHAADAPRIQCPVLFMVQWNDELFDRDGAFDLFDAVGSADKRLHAHPGKHGEVPAEGIAATRAFLAEHLGKA